MYIAMIMERVDMFNSVTSQRQPQLQSNKDLQNTQYAEVPAVYKSKSQCLSGDHARKHRDGKEEQQN